MRRSRSTKPHAEGQQQPFVGDLLREKRQAAGISLGEMARRLRRSKSTLSTVETGSTRPSQRLLQAYERELHLPSGSLAGRHNPIAGLIEAARGSTVYMISGALEDRDAIPTEADVIEGVRNSFRCAIALLAAAAETAGQQSEHDEICITFLGDQETFNIEPGLRQKWLMALCRALEAGCRVVHVWRPGESMRQHVELMTELLKLLNPSWRYEPFYVPGTDAGSVAPCDLVIVPHQGALQLFSTYQSRHADSAFFFPPTSKHFEILRRHFTLLLAHAEPLLKTYAVSSNDFDEALLAAEQQDGEEVLLLNNVSFKIMPGYVHVERVRRILASNRDRSERRRALELRMQRALKINEWRRRRLEERLRGWPVYHISSRKAWERMVKTGDYSDNWIDEFGTPARLTEEEIVACVHQKIHDLQTFPHYELALVDQESGFGTFQNFWEVIGDHAALFAARLQHRDESAQERADILHLSTQVSVVVQAIRDYFFQTWHELLPEERDKNQVIAWLQALIV